MKDGIVSMFFISVYDYNDTSGERFMYEEIKNIVDAVKRYEEYKKVFEKHKKPYLVLLYTENGNIIFGF